MLMHGVHIAFMRVATEWHLAKARLPSLMHAVRRTYGACDWLVQAFMQFTAPYTEASNRHLQILGIIGILSIIPY